MLIYSLYYVGLLLFGIICLMALIIILYLIIENIVG